TIATPTPGVTSPAPVPATTAPSSPTPSATTSPSARPRQVAPLAVGQPDGTPPYLHWTARTSGGQPVGGATFQVEVESCFLFFCGWDSFATVEDCIAQSATLCTGRDRDPDAGEF